ncbi:hypothetical protein [Nitrobacter sp.]|uniref:hypothetical protein n=1 Tax=Nitrobacter sp. TaxID=29420 RepID=UPI003F6530B6
MTIKVQLLEPIKGFEGVQISELVLRAPKYMDVMTLGEPTTYARSEGGMIYQAEKDGVIQSYIERLVVEPKHTDLLNQLSLADTLKLKDTINGFFGAAREAIYPS